LWAGECLQRSPDHLAIKGKRRGKKGKKGKVGKGWREERRRGEVTP